MSTIKVTNITPQSGNNVYLTGSLTVSDTLIAKEVRTEVTQSVILFQSGSTKFGDSSDDTHQFTGSITTSGSLLANGPVTFNSIPWPAIGSELHLFKTEPFTVNLASGDRDYGYLRVGLEHFETGSTYHNSLLINALSNDVTPNFGTELNVGPTRNHMRVFPSGSSIGLDYTNMANVSVEDLENGRTQALIYSNEVQIGARATDHLLIGNLNTSVTQSYEGNILFGTDLKLVNTLTLISGALSIEGIGNLSSSLSSTNTNITTLIATSGALDERVTQNELNIENNQTTVDIYTGSTNTRLVNLESFSSSLDATFATDAQVATAVSSLNAATSSYATNATLNTVSASVDSLNSATSSYALNTVLNTVSSSVDSLNAATSSYATSATHISIGELKALVSSSATYNDFTASVLVL